MGREISAPSLFQLGYYWEAKIFLTSVKLDLYTPLGSGPKTAAEVASAMGADPENLERLLDSLVAIGLLKREGRRYANTPVVAEFLVKTSPFYIGELMLLQDEEWEAWGKLEEGGSVGKAPGEGEYLHESAGDRREDLAGPRSDGETGRPGPGRENRSLAV
ncbi:MAG: hypothetical protein MPW15_07750 [Candidatus Manganitrophus sp.]|nr:hypothetical protein [Candidatus Manganitrophus sp.]